MLKKAIHIIVRFKFDRVGLSENWQRWNPFRILYKDSFVVWQTYGIGFVTLYQGNREKSHFRSTDGT